MYFGCKHDNKSIVAECSECLKEEIKIYRDAIESAIEWRNFDGDGVSDPVRKQLIDSLFRNKQNIVRKGDLRLKKSLCKRN
jgi:hypothetical protein